MKQQNIPARVISVIVEKLGIDEEEVTMEAKLQDDLGADSLDMVELVMELENEFSISIPDSFVDDVVTVQEAITCVEERCADKK